MTFKQWAAPCGLGAIGFAAAVCGALGAGAPQAKDAGARSSVHHGAGLPFALCFAEGTSESEIERLHEEFAQTLPTPRFFTGTRWPGPAGQAVVLTYSFPPDGLLIGGGGDGLNVLHDRLNAQFASFGGETRWKQLFRDSFDRWTALTGNAYIEVPDDGGGFWPATDGPVHGGTTRGDIRIVMGDLGTGGTLAANYFPELGDMILNSRINFAQGPASNFVFLRNIIMHEHGHGQGLFHSCPQNASKLMEPGLNTNFDGPQLDDIRGAQSLYGDRFEPQPADLDANGFLPNLTYVITQVSLHNSADNDLYLFNVPSTSTLNATIRSEGIVYQNGPQNGDGTCSAGSGNDALNAQDLQFDIISPSSQILATVNNVGPGGIESVTDFPLANSGVHRIRVRNGGSGTGVQMYRVTLLLRNQALAGDLNGDGAVNSIDLAVLLGSWGMCPAPPLACTSDINGDGAIDAQDLALMLGAWTG